MGEDVYRYEREHSLRCIESQMTIVLESRTIPPSTRLWDISCLVKGVLSVSRCAGYH